MADLDLAANPLRTLIGKPVTRLKDSIAGDFQIGSKVALATSYFKSPVDRDPELFMQPYRFGTIMRIDGNAAGSEGSAHIQFETCVVGDLFCVPCSSHHLYLREEVDTLFDVSEDFLPGGTLEVTKPLTVATKWVISDKDEDAIVAQLWARV